MPERRHRVLLNFMRRENWTVHFIEADCRTPIGTKTRYIDFAAIDQLRAFVLRCNPEPGALDEFDTNVRRWSRGSIYVNLTEAQYSKLKTHR